MPVCRMSPSGSKLKADWKGNLYSDQNEEDGMANPKPPLEMPVTRTYVPARTHFSVSLLCLISRVKA